MYVFVCVCVYFYAETAHQRTINVICHFIRVGPSLWVCVCVCDDADGNDVCGRVCVLARVK